MNTSSYYSLGYTLWKAFWAWAQAAGVCGAADVAAVGWPETAAEWGSKWPVLVIALVPALWRVVENVRKNAGAAGPLWNWPWDKVTP